MGLKIADPAVGAAGSWNMCSLLGGSNTSNYPSTALTTQAKIDLLHDHIGANIGCMQSALRQMEVA